MLYAYVTDQTKMQQLSLVFCSVASKVGTALFVDTFGFAACQG